MTMERAEWLKQMRSKAEALYDQFSPQYWVTFGLYANETHLQYLHKFLARLAPRSTLLSAGCGAGRYDGILLEAGHSVVGIDQSAGMLARARERFPAARYEQVGLQEMDFREEFDGVICIDAMEHICPEDWPGILQGFQNALKPGGVLYLTVDLGQADETQKAYERAKALGLPVVYGEVADRVDELYERVRVSGMSALPMELADGAAYHYHPPLEQVRAWLAEAGLAIEEQGTGNWYEHFVVSKIA
jgi:cyclopropane fatty-acyl-phospholipid synthase-like methyltransferase